MKLYGIEKSKMRGGYGFGSAFVGKLYHKIIVLPRFKHAEGGGQFPIYKRMERCLSLSNIFKFKKQNQDPGPHSPYLKG